MDQKLTARQITDCLLSYFVCKNRVAVIANWSVPAWGEADVYSVTNSLYAHEVEVKVSRSDYLRDFVSKKYKHMVLSGEVDTTQKNVPRTFSFAVPAGLVSVNEVPKYCGLIYIHPSVEGRSPVIEVVKKGPKIASAQKMSGSHMASMLRRLTWSYMRDRERRHSQE